MSEDQPQDDEIHNIEDDDFPTYANEDNKRLNEEIKDKRGFIEKFNEELEELGERVKILSEHYKSVQQELVHTQTLVDAKSKEIESEDHMKQLYERQTGRLYAELQKLEQKTAEQQDRLNSIQNQIFKGNEKLDQYKLEMNWNQEELEQWALASGQKEEDYIALEKYRRADEAKIKELTLHIEKLTLEVRKLQEDLDLEVTETQASQIELDKTAEEFKKMHSQRHQLYEQLQDNLKDCSRKDAQIKRLGEQFAEDKLRLKQKQKQLEKRIEFLKNTESDIKRVESEITLATRQLADMRLQEINWRENLLNFRDDVDIERNQLSAAASELANKRIQIISLQKELARQNQRQEAAKQKAEQTRYRLQNEVSNIENLESGARAAENQYKDTQTRKEVLFKKNRDMKELLFKQTQELFELRATEARLLGEISGSLAAGRNLQAALNKKDQEVQHQYVLLYNADYSIQVQERKVDEVRGVQVTEQNKELKEKIKAREAELQQREEHLEKVTKSVKQLTDDLRLLERIHNKASNERSILHTNLREAELQIKMIEKEVEQNHNNRDEVLVQHDSMKLEVKKLRDKLLEKTDLLFSEENRKQQLKMTMEEREKEIKVHKETLLAEKRAAEDERHEVMVELSDRQSKVQNLKVKYENLCYKNRAKDEDGEERTQAYYVIKAAQEREELQRYGDELDAKIRKAEREIRALNNTLDHLKNRNSKFRDSFVQRGDETEQQTKDALEEQCRVASEQLFRKRRDYNNLQSQYESEMRRLVESQNRIDVLQKVITDKQSEMERIEPSLDKQRQQIDRAVSSAQQKRVQLDELQELDTNTTLYKLKNQYLTAAIATLIREVPEISQLLEGPLVQHGIQLPSRPPSVTSSRSSRQSVQQTLNIFYQIQFKWSINQYCNYNLNFYNWLYNYKMIQQQFK